MPLILGLSSEQTTLAALANAISSADFEFKSVARGEEIEPASTARRGPAEPTSGVGAGFIARLVKWQPALVLVDLASTQIPWEVWVAALKSSPATRRTPVVGFAETLTLKLKTRAEAVGCEVVLAQAELLKDLPGVLNQYVRRQDEAALHRDCQQTLSALAREGITLHNRGEFFEAHEVLEHAWNADATAARELYRGLLQISVAYLQIERGNYNGALKMFLRLRQWLDPLPEVCRGVNVAQARADALAARAALEALGPSRIAEFNRHLFKPIIVLSEG